MRTSDPGYRPTARVKSALTVICSCRGQKIDGGGHEGDDDEAADDLADHGRGAVEPAERHTGACLGGHQRPPPEVPGRRRSGSCVPGSARPGVPTGTTRLETHVSNQRPVPSVLA